MKSPNILLIMADQLAPQFTGAYGHEVAKTPAIDSLAEQGCRFDAAYTPSPICAPARFSMMAGQLPIRIRAYDNAAEFSSSVPTFAHYLRLMGYHTCLAGKMHFVGPDQLHGFNERLTTDVYPADYAWTPNWQQHDERIDKWYHNMDSVLEAGVAGNTYQFDFDDEVGFHAIRKVFDYARTPDQLPFLLTVSFIHPHDPYVTRRRWWDLYESENIDMPETAPEDCTADPHSLRLMADFQINEASIGEEHIRNARRAYYANTSYVDHWVGKLLKALEETSLDKNTVVVFTADHGDMLGERGLWYKTNFFEHSVRVPLIFAGPGIENAAVADHCSLMDLLPTFLDLASREGETVPEVRVPLDGASLLPLLEGSNGGNDRVVYSEYCAESTSHPMFMIRSGDYKYIHCDSDPPQLFDLNADPLELNNLAVDSEYQSIAATFAKQVKDRWNSPVIRDDVIACQRSRQVVHEAMQHGSLTSWDYHPVSDAANAYVRNHLDWTVSAARQRFPIN